MPASRKTLTAQHEPRAAHHSVVVRLEALPEGAGLGGEVEERRAEGEGGVVGRPVDVPSTGTHKRTVLAG